MITVLLQMDRVLKRYRAHEVLRGADADKLRGLTPGHVVVLLDGDAMGSDLWRYLCDEVLRPMLSGHADRLDVYEGLEQRRWMPMPPDASGCNRLKGG